MPGSGYSSNLHHLAKGAKGLMPGPDPPETDRIPSSHHGHSFDVRKLHHKTLCYDTGSLVHLPETKSFTAKLYYFIAVQWHRPIIKEGDPLKHSDCLKRRHFPMLLGRSLEVARRRSAIRTIFARPPTWSAGHTTLNPLYLH